MEPKLENNLETDRLFLEPLRRDHARLLFTALSDSNIYSFIPGDPPPSISELEARFELLESRISPDGHERWLNWAVRLKVDAIYIGIVQATIEETPRARLAYLLSSDFRGMGYATEACWRVVESLHSDHGVVEVFAEVDTRNEASWRLLERLSFERTMTKERADFFKGSYSDEYLYRLDLKSGAA